MHGRAIAHIIRKKREAKAAKNPLATPVAAEPQSSVLSHEPSQLEIDFAAAWACFEKLEGPHHMWRIEKLIDRGMSWKVLGIRGPKRTTVQDSVFEDIVRYARSRAKKGKDKFDIVKVWFGADAGLNTKRDIVMSHCTIKDMPTMQARYDWLKWMNGNLTEGLPMIIDYYEGIYGKSVVLPKMDEQAALEERTLGMYRHIQSDQYQRTRQPQWRGDMESQAGAGSAVPRGHSGRPTQVTHLKGWEKHPNNGLPFGEKKSRRKKGK